MKGVFGRVGLILISSIRPISPWYSRFLRSLGDDFRSKEVGQSCHFSVFSDILLNVLNVEYVRYLLDVEYIWYLRASKQKRRRD
jgi:hypothetical protein